MKNLTLEHIAQACKGIYKGSEADKTREVTGIYTDSRKVREGSLFVPIKGARADGHDFIEGVMEKGALATLSEKDLGEKPYPYIQVDSSLQAVKDIAEYYLKQLKIPVVGITGSVGKTSTKEFIAAVLSQKYRVHKTQGNYNNEIGVPLTVLSMPEDTEMAVLEMGINHFGEMHRLSRIARPDICVMTNIGQCHLEYLGSREGILKAKSEIFDYMKEDGCVVLNGDDDMLSRITQVKGKRPVFYGVSSGRTACGETGRGLDIFAKDIRMKGILGSDAVFSHDGKTFAVHIPLPGEHMVYNALAAAAVGFQAGLTEEEIAAGIAATQSVSGRSRVIQAAGRIVIDDCYNANPVSMEAAIDLLAQAAGDCADYADSEREKQAAGRPEEPADGVSRRTVAVLGDMFELGEKEKELHGRVGRYLIEKGTDCVICAGELSAAMYEGALKAAEESGRQPSGGIHYFPDRQELLDGIDALLKPGDIVLVKASHSMGFEEVVKRLTE